MSTTFIGDGPHFDTTNTWWAYGHHSYTPLRTYQLHLTQKWTTHAWLSVSVEKSTWSTGETPAEHHQKERWHSLRATTQAESKNTNNLLSTLCIIIQRPRILIIEVGWGMILYTDCMELERGFGYSSMLFQNNKPVKCNDYYNLIIIPFKINCKNKKECCFPSISTGHSFSKWSKEGASSDYIRPLSLIHRQNGNWRERCVNFWGTNALCSHLRYDGQG